MLKKIELIYGQLAFALVSTFEGSDAFALSVSELNHLNFSSLRQRCFNLLKVASRSTCGVCSSGVNTELHHLKSQVK